MKNRRAYALWHAAFAGATILVAGSQLGDLVGQHTAGIVGMLVGALQVSVISFYGIMGKPIPVP